MMLFIERNKVQENNRWHDIVISSNNQQVYKLYSRNNQNMHKTNTWLITWHAHGQLQREWNEKYGV